METKLNIAKQDLSSGTITEEHKLFFGKVFRGKSAYQYAIESGMFTGTEEEFKAYVGSIGNLSDETIEAVQDAREAAKSATQATERATAVIDKIEKIGEGFPTTHASLVALRDAGQLVPGAFYRITDYECTTTQADTRSANHPFDIIVQALNERTLSENASAIQHEGDTYFADAKLEAWKLKYAIDNDPSRFSWAKEKVIEQPAKWSCDWGVLEKKNSADVSSDYELATIDGEQKYLYRPVQPTSHLNGKQFYRNVVVGSITSPEGFIYEADTPVTYSEEDDTYYTPSEIQVKTADGVVVATFTYDNENRFYDANDYSDMMRHPIFFVADEYTEMDGVYLLTPSEGIDDWWENYIGGTINFTEKEYYNGSVDSLYYACSSPLGKGTTYINVVTDKAHLYYYANTDYEPYETEYTLIDTVVYSAYVAPYDGGKGVIYNMVDEHNNDCPYDFKNIQFKKNNEWYYTFSQSGNDLSLTDYCVGNYILPHTNQNFSDGTTAVKTIIPMLVFDKKYNSSSKFVGILNNKIRVPITKGYIAGTRIAENEWEGITGGEHDIVQNVNIVASGVVYGNCISGSALTFEIGSTTAPISALYANNIVLPNFSTGGIFRCLCSAFNNNTLNLSEGKRGFTITSGSIISCEIENSNYARTQANTDTDDITFGTDVVLRNTRIRIYNDLTINYGNTTSTNAPLRFLDIDARGWNATTITIPSTFPANAPHELKVAKNSAGVVKMWSEADLVS